MILQETEPDLPCECLKICYGGMGGQLPATGIGTLEAAILEGLCWHKSFLEATSSPIAQPIDSRTGLPQAKQ